MDQFKHPYDSRTQVDLRVRITTRAPFCARKGLLIVIECLLFASEQFLWRYINYYHYHQWLNQLFFKYN